MRDIIKRALRTWTFRPNLSKINWKPICFSPHITLQPIIKYHLHNHLINSRLYIPIARTNRAASIYIQNNNAGTTIVRHKYIHCDGERISTVCAPSQNPSKPIARSAHHPYLLYSRPAWFHIIAFWLPRASKVFSITISDHDFGATR